MGDASPYATYLANLPVGVPGIPIFFGAEAMAALQQYPPVSEQVKRRCRWLATYARDELARLPGTAADPFCGQRVDANALGTPWWAQCVLLSCLAVATSRRFLDQHVKAAACVE